MMLVFDQPSPEIFHPWAFSVNVWYNHMYYNREALLLGHQAQINFPHFSCFIDLSSPTN